MAHKGRPQAEARHASSSDEEEEEEEEASSEEDSESKKNQRDKPSPVKKPSFSKKPDSAVQTPTHAPSSDDDESGSESDSEPHSKPMEEAPKSMKKTRSEPSPASTPVKRKRSEKIKTDRDSKKVKKKKEDSKKTTSGEEPKKQLFQRLWSEEDEVEILKGMIEYINKGSDPLSDMIGFHDFIKKSLHVDVSKAQLSDKVRRLRKKYENNASKSKEGEDRAFSKPHERNSFELSKKIWGSEANNGGLPGIESNSTKFNGKDKKKQNQKAITESQMKIDELASPDRVVASEGTKNEFEKSAAGLLPVSTFESKVEEEILKHGLDLISGSKKSELEEKWRKLKVEEVELYLKRVDLMREQTELVLEALKSPKL